MKHILTFLTFFVVPLLAKEDPKLTELMAKFNEIQKIEQAISEKVKHLQDLYSEGIRLIGYMSYGYDEEQRDFIMEEANKLQECIAHAINNNIDVSKAIREPLCPDLILHRNELNRLQVIIVQACMNFWFLNSLGKQYLEVTEKICQLKNIWCR